jgi:2-polyprenyl-6-hydroxyphenyl methylase/3-demethylubiquinone-9 3-methyltransferase
MEILMANIDQTEIEKFNTLSENDWWDSTGSCSPLHHINPLRVEFIQHHAELHQMKVLDIGCGGGILCESLAKLGADVTGIDLSENVINIANSHQKNLNIHYEVASAEDFAEIHPAQFDVITCMEMLEHVPDPASIIASCEKLLKPQGKLFLSTLNRNLKSYLFAIIGAEWILNLLPKSTHDYSKFIRPSELSRVLRQHHFNNNDMQGIQYTPFSKKYFLNADISVNYLVYAQKNT